MHNVIRLCLDLNIWVAALLADAKYRQGTSCQSIVSIVFQGKCISQPVQLVISWGMLNRLRQVLTQKLQVPIQETERYLDTIVAYAQLGAMDLSPQLTIGGTGVLPIRDTEDAHVLETAISGQAQVLITANFKDFIFKDTMIIVSERYAIHIAPDHKVQIVHPYQFMAWIHEGKIPSPP